MIRSLTGIVLALGVSLASSCGECGRRYPSDLPEKERLPVPGQSLRLGRGVQPDGNVPDSQRTDVLMSYDTIYISIATSDVPPGSLGCLTIYEEGNDVPVWRNERSVFAGSSHLTFGIGPGSLPVNRYRAVLIVGERVAEHTFQVRERSA